MLPFTKRPNPQQDAELIDSGEIEVVRVAPSVPPSALPRPSLSRSSTAVSPVSQRYPAPPSERPRVFERLSHDDEMTTVMPSKRGSSFPPASSHAPRSSSRPQPRMNANGNDDERTMLRPLTPAQPISVAPQSGRIPPGPSSRPANFLPPAPPSPQSYGQLHVQTPPTMLGSAIPAEVRAQAIAAMHAHQSQNLPAYHSQNLPAFGPPSSSQRVNGPVSEPRIDPPATVITTRTRVLIGRPTVSWAAALVAMGVFVGLVTAVVARGDADSLIDATASFVDPSHSTARAAAAQPATPIPPPAAVAPIAPPAPQPVAVAPIAPPVVAPAPAPIAPPIPIVDTKPASVPASDLPVAQADKSDKTDKADKADKKPYVAPRAVTRSWARPAPHADAQPAVAAAPKPAPVPKASKKAAAADKGDDDAAAAADKLAREQLEAALK